MLSVAHGTSVMIENILKTDIAMCASSADSARGYNDRGQSRGDKGRRDAHGRVRAAADLRAGTALAVAGLAAQGSTTIENVCLIDRGWQDMEEKLRSLGADIRRES